jgi:hypothetical protein
MNLDNKPGAVSRSEARGGCGAQAQVGMAAGVTSGAALVAELHQRRLPGEQGAARQGIAQTPGR